MSFWFASSAALLLLWIGLRAALRGKLSPRLQYALWLPVLLRLLLPVTVFQSPFSLQNLTEQPQTARAEEQLRELPPAAYLESESAGDYDSGANAGEDFLFAETAAPAERLGQEPALRARDVLGVLWAVGAAATAGVLFGCNLSFARRLRRGRRAFEGEKGMLPAYVCDGLPTPCLFGLFRPAIYLTPAAAEDEAALRHVLVHEETHYLHWDPFWAALRCLALALHWFNPLAWYAAALSRRDAETACDAGAVARLGEEARAEYGRVLIGLSARRAGKYDLLCCATTMGGGKQALKERVAVLAKNPKTRIAALLAVLAALTAAGLCLFTGAEPSRSDGPAERILIAPGETAFIGEELLRYDVGGYFRYSLSWTPEDAALTVGLQSAESAAYVSQTRDGGRAEGNIDRVPPGVYRVFVRNDAPGAVTVADMEFEGADTGMDTALPDRGEPPALNAAEAKGQTGLLLPIDLNHDGVQETLSVESSGNSAVISLAGPEGEPLLVISEPQSAHAGWARWFKYVSDEGEDYLLRYCPAMGTGIGSYFYELTWYDAPGWERPATILARENSVSFSMTPSSIELPAQEMEAFAEEVNALLERSTLLVSTVGGGVVLGPTAGALYYEDYGFMDAELELPPALPLRDKIERYAAHLRQLWAPEQTVSTQPPPGNGTPLAQPEPPEEGAALAEAEVTPVWAETEESRAMAAAMQSLRFWGAFLPRPAEDVGMLSIEMTHAVNELETQALRDGGSEGAFVIDATAEVHFEKYSDQDYTAVRRMVVAPSEDSETGYAVLSSADISLPDFSVPASASDLRPR